MRAIVLIVILALAMPAAPLSASSSDAWQHLFRQARSRCIQASHLKAARASPPIIFGDASAQVAILVTGAFPQVAMKGARGSSLCLYDRRTGRAEVEEAQGWRVQP